MREAASPEAVVRRYYDEAFNTGSTDVLRDLCSEGMQQRLASTVSAFRAAFSGLTVSVDFMVADDDRVTARTTLRGTHAGEFWGVAATGRFVEFTSIDIFRVQEGRITQHWEETNMLEVLRKLTSVTIGNGSRRGLVRLSRSGVAWAVIAGGFGLFAGAALMDSRNDDALYEDEYFTEAYGRCAAAQDERTYLAPPAVPQPVENVETYRLALGAFEVARAEFAARMERIETEIAAEC